jgi:sugar lactone lactonase YvrE
MNVSTMFASKCVLGESPLWHQKSKSCFWVDIHHGVLYQYNLSQDRIRQWDVNDHVSLVIESYDCNLILAVQGGVLSFDPETGSKIWIADIDKDIPNNRCNDGGCDAMGRLWIGTMDKQCKRGAGSLYRVDRDLIVKKMIGGRSIPNGIVWSIQNERMYFIDTISQKVQSYLYNKSTGDIYYEKDVVQIPLAMGMPDGMAIDAEGMLWIALYNGGAVTRWDPSNGHLLQKVDLPALHITNCAFCG